MLVERRGHGTGHGGASARLDRRHARRSGPSPCLSALRPVCASIGAHRRLAADRPGSEATDAAACVFADPRLRDCTNNAAPERHALNGDSISAEPRSAGAATIVHPRRRRSLRSRGRVGGWGRSGVRRCCSPPVHRLLGRRSTRSTAARQPIRAGVGGEQGVGFGNGSTRPRLKPNN